MNIDYHDLTLQIWDSAGQDDCSKLLPLGYADADVFLLCYSIADRDSFKSIEKKWMAELRTCAPAVPIILVGTTCDFRKGKDDSGMVSTSEANDMLQKNSFFGYVECSAKTLTHYKQSFVKAIYAVLKLRYKLEQKEN